MSFFFIYWTFYFFYLFKMSQNSEDLYLQSYPFTTAAAIIGSVDRKVFLVLYDGRCIVGVLRSFDHFGNLIIHDAQERFYYPENKEYAVSDKENVMLIRGENLVLMGELDIDKEDDLLNNWTKIKDFQIALDKWSTPNIVNNELNDKYKSFGLEKPQRVSF